MAELVLLQCTGKTGEVKVSLVYDEATLEAEKIVWYHTDPTHDCTGVQDFSSMYNLTAEDFDTISPTVSEFYLPMELYLVETDDGLDTSNVSNWLKAR